MPKLSEAIYAQSQEVADDVRRLLDDRNVSDCELYANALAIFQIVSPAAKKLDKLCLDLARALNMEEAAGI